MQISFYFQWNDKENRLLSFLVGTGSIKDERQSVMINSNL